MLLILKYYHKIALATLILVIFSMKILNDYTKVIEGDVELPQPKAPNKPASPVFTSPVTEEPTVVVVNYPETHKAVQLSANAVTLVKGENEHSLSGSCEMVAPKAKWIQTIEIR